MGNISDEYMKKDITETGKDYEKPYKEPTVRSTGIHRNYAIFKANEKIKNFEQIDTFINYVLRKNLKPEQTEEIELAKKNKIIVGDENLRKTLEQYVGDVKIKKNAVIAREIILGASVDFFKNLSEYDKNRWIQKQKDFMYQEFGPNFLFMISHQDRSTLHCHALVSCKFYDAEKKQYKLQHCRYFDGIKKLMDWHDKYSAAMSKDFNLHRGIVGARSMRVEMRKIYGALENPTYELTPEEAVRRAALLDIKLKHAENQVEAVYLMNKTLVKENSELREHTSEVSKSITIYHEVINKMIEKYGEKEINSMFLLAETKKRQENLHL